VGTHGKKCPYEKGDAIEERELFEQAHLRRGVRRETLMVSASEIEWVSLP